jgi:uncharacterized membrane protein YhdT
MIPLVVFYLHIVALAAVFSKRYQAENASEGFLAVFFMGLIFFVGWAMASFLMKLVMPAEGLASWFDRDAASLLLLTIAEGILYYFYFKDEQKTDVASGEQPTT